MLRLELFLVLFGVTLGLRFGGRQFACVAGQLTCSDGSLRKTFLMLWDEDINPFGPNPNDLMGGGYPDSNGNFSVCGSATDGIGEIDPVLKVYTLCNANMDILGGGCMRKLVFPVPSEYINDKIYQLEVDLAEKQQGERRRCFSNKEIKDFESTYGRPNNNW